MRVLGEVTPRARLLRAERRQYAENIAQRWDACLEVQLRALREIRRLAKVIEREHFGAAFAQCAHERGRGDLVVARAEQMVAEGAHRLRADVEIVAGFLAAQHNVSLIEQHIGARLHVEDAFEVHRRRAHLMQANDQRAICESKNKNKSKKKGKRLQTKSKQTHASSNNS